MKSLGRWLMSGAIAASVFTALPSAAHAGVDIAFGAAAPIGDNGQLFVSISSNYFNREPHVVADWSQRFTDPDDLSVFLHICSHTRVSPEMVYSYRRQGMPWFDVGMRVGVPVDTWFVPVQGDPGPPYGKAYGYWRQHQRDPRYVMHISDHQCRDLVAVRMAHDYYHVTPQVAMDWRREGRDTREMMNREYRSRHHGEGDHGHDRADDNDHHDHGHGHGNGHGHDKDDDHGGRH
ncbi:MAG TPA: hypothetical protein VFV19_13620 [Candidatus Polarisedimenticolaceae bacterium]|nr:hypothetical protein [Candidatus Polarisedimenticolaceae bacterium]